MKAEHREHLRVKGKLRWRQIQQLERHFNLTRDAATQKWTHHKGNNTLEDLMATVDSETPPHPDDKCPKCGGELAARTSAIGPFLGCIRYPECDGKRNMPKDYYRVPGQVELEEIQRKLTATLNFVRDVGGIAAAEKLLSIAKQVLNI